MTSRVSFFVLVNVLCCAAVRFFFFVFFFFYVSTGVNHALKVWAEQLVHRSRGASIYTVFFFLLARVVAVEEGFAEFTQEFSHTQYFFLSNLHWQSQRIKSSKR